ncbi:hypothetical protein [Wolbachia endosymbiont (group A) of Brachyopa scutellaris]|uniref:hypothetical protein n=1 Tax=Wolbachia endosymbiont (group A) of Brachyopa scutellaris TaxID=3066140 RepID=UPI003132FC91
MTCSDYYEKCYMCHATWMTPLKEMNRLFKIVLNRGITFTSKISYYHFLIYVL